ncbi:M48 family metallopeptidase [Desulfonatronospira sp.]|uniref:M48 family metallopeptidase n=1 Tax=Desulfonatronospira sp. TaxID=1962951 RepID=UPI0025BCD561|nr:M48 family metallopeptidase [Desulfonatronospira sp.]
MDFFKHKEQAIRTSRYLVFLFVLGTIGVLAIIYLFIFGYFTFSYGTLEQAWVAMNMYRIEMAILGGVVALIIVGGTLFQVSRLSKGGTAVADILKARPVSPQTRNPGEQKALNVVHEMSIASGLTKIPKLYVMDGEDSINAFAAGWHEDDAVIGLTSGAMEHLSRSELQAVVGHEISHIQNGDMYLNIKLMGIIFGLLILTYMGSFVIRNALYGSMISGNRSRTDPRALIVILILGTGLIMAGLVGMVLGNIIKAAISRQREYLADASAVQFTRMPQAMEGALIKIRDMSRTKNRNHLNNPNAEQASHMFFTEAVSKFESLFATHPPIEDRIRRINPDYGRE